MAIAALATWGRRSQDPPAVRAVAIAALLVVGTASTELFILFGGPLALLALRRLAWRGRDLRRVAALVAAPAALVAGLSAAIRPSVDRLAATVTEAGAAGLDIDVDRQNSISALGATVGDGLTGLGEVSPRTVLWYAALFGGLYLFSVGLMWAVAGRPAPRLALAHIAVYATAAVFVSTIGVDYRRWWALAFAAAICTLVILPQTQQDDEQRVGYGNALVACALLALSVRSQQVPYWPYWDPTFGEHFNFSIRWLRGQGDER